jgi:hypothetical protein
LTNNPYAPPASEVGELPDPELRPKQVVVAVCLLWVSIAFGPLVAIVRAFMYLSDSGIEPRMWFDLMIGQLTALGIWVFLTLKVWSRRNWARILLLVFVVITVMMSIFTLTRIATPSLWSIVSAYWPTPIRVCAVALLFIAPAKIWFANSRT